jgi:hypothetical protein
VYVILDHDLEAERSVIEEGDQQQTLTNLSVSFALTKFHSLY